MWRAARPSIARSLVLLAFIYHIVHGERYPIVTASCTNATTRAATACPVPSTPLAAWTPTPPAGLVYYATYVGDWVWSLLNQTRGLSDDWYRNSLRSILIAKCVADGDTSRCVPIDSADAARHANTSCLRMHDRGNCHDLDLCERAVSCRWVPPSPSSAREEYFTAAQAAAATLWATQEYPKSIAPYALLGIVIALVVLVSIIMFAILRFGCDKCYGTTPLRKGYTVVDRWLPISAVAVSSAMLVLLGVIVFLVSPAYIRGVRQTLDTIQATATSLVQLRTDLSHPLADMAASFQTAVAFEPPASAAAPLLQTALANATSTSRAFVDRFSPAHVGSFPSYACQAPPTTAPPYAATSNMPCTPCPDLVCADAARRVDAILTPVAAAVRDIQTLPAWTRDQVQQVAASADVDAALAAVMALGASAAAFSSSVYPQLHDVLGHIQLGGFGGVVGVFAVAMTSSVLALIGIMHGLRSSSSGCLYVLHASWVLAALFAVVGFVASGGLLAASVLGNDVCMYMALVLETPEPFLPPPAAALVRSCARPSATAADDIARALAALHLDDVTRLGCVLDTGLAASAATVQDSANTTNAAVQTYAAQLAVNAEPAAFANDGLMRFLVAQASTAAGVPWNATTLVTPWTADGLANATQECSGATHPALCYMYARCKDAKCFEKFETAYAYRTAYDEIGAVADAMQRAYDRNATEEDRLARQMRSVADAVRAESAVQLANLRQGPIGAIARRTRGLQCVSSVSCGFVRTNAAKLDQFFCKDTLRFTVLAAAALFVASGFYLSLALATIMLQKRLQGRVKMMWWKRRSVVSRQKKRQKDGRRHAMSSLSSSDPVPPARPPRISGLVMMPETAPPVEVVP